EALIGQQVTLCGWADVARDLGGLCFIDLRDHEGIVQVVAEPSEAEGNAQVLAVAAKVGYEDCLRVTGTVRRREKPNPKLPTGQVEVVATSIEVLNKAEPLPFHAHENAGEDIRLKYRYLDLRTPVMQRKMRTRTRLVQALRRWLDARGFQDIETPTLTKAEPLPCHAPENAGEDIRLKYRYLDLRTPVMQRKMRTRTRLVQALRRWLDARGFQDIETPILTKATPEGARDFLVPARMHPGEFYALPQSPQLFKRIRMVAGFDRYYQIARCFRDEALRADRQLEFTQLDMEFAWVDEKIVQGTTEQMVRDVFAEVMDVDLGAFPRMTYAEAMRRYGPDKPDLRNALQLLHVAHLARDR